MSYIKNKRKKIESLLNSDEKEIIVEGNSKIMLSCPHSVIHYRNGEIKYDEPDTLIIADYLHKKFDLSFIYYLLKRHIFKRFLFIQLKR